MAELRAGLDAALSGRTQIFLLTGEAGIGKTRLASEIAAEGESRAMRVVWGRCCEAAGAPPYWPMTQVARALTEGLDTQRLGAMLGPAAPEIARFVGGSGVAAASGEAPQDDAEQARFRVFDSFATLVASSARAKPLMIIFDDLHEADEASWLMLRFAVREIHDAPLMIVAAYRDTELRGTDALPRVIADLYRSGRQLPLAGLTEAEVAQVVAGDGGRAPDRQFVSALHRTTGGNPFFISEVIRAMKLDGELPAQREAHRAEFRVPESVRASIRGRLSALGPSARAMLRAAAALGSQFDAAPLERVTGLAPAQLLSALDRAIVAGIVAPDGPGHYRFCHALIREVIYQDLDLTARARLHAEIVSVLEALYSAEPAAHLDQIAFHAVAAVPVGSSDRAIEYATGAAEAAFRAFAYEQAARHWQSALAIAERGPADPRMLARILERLGDAYSITEFDHPRGIECIERAAKIYESAAMPIEAAHLHARLGLMLARRSPAMNIARAMAHIGSPRQFCAMSPTVRRKSGSTSALRRPRCRRSARRRGWRRRIVRWKSRRTWARNRYGFALPHIIRTICSTAAGWRDARTLVDDAQHCADRRDDLGWRIRYRMERRLPSARPCGIRARPSDGLSASLRGRGWRKRCFSAAC